MLWSRELMEERFVLSFPVPSPRLSCSGRVLDADKSLSLSYSESYRTSSRPPPKLPRSPLPSFLPSTTPRSLPISPWFLE